MTEEEKNYLKYIDGLRQSFPCIGLTHGMGNSIKETPESVHEWKMRMKDIEIKELEKTIRKQKWIIILLSLILMSYSLSGLLGLLK